MSDKMEPAEAAPDMSASEIALRQAPGRPEAPNASFSTQESAIAPTALPQETKATKARRRPSNTTLNVLSALIGIGVLAAGVFWVFYTMAVDREVPYFAIPLVMTVPVIVAVTFRTLWGD